MTTQREIFDMIMFRDFVPDFRDKGGLFRMPVMEQLSVSLKEANTWIDKYAVDVVNIETVVLPNIHSPDEAGSADVQLRTSGDMSAYWHQFIRVWHRSD
jgi:hypothetical protein